VRRHDDPQRRRRDDGQGGAAHLDRGADRLGSGRPTSATSSTSRPPSRTALISLPSRPTRCCTRPVAAGSRARTEGSSCEFFLRAGDDRPVPDFRPPRRRGSNLLGPGPTARGLARLANSPRKGVRSAGVLRRGATRAEESDVPRPFGTRWSRGPVYADPTACARWSHEPGSPNSSAKSACRRRSRSWAGARLGRGRRRPAATKRTYRRRGTWRRPGAVSSCWSAREAARAAPAPWRRPFDDQRYTVQAPCALRGRPARPSWLIAGARPARARPLRFLLGRRPPEPLGALPTNGTSFGPVARTTTTPQGPNLEGDGGLEEGTSTATGPYEHLLRRRPQEAAHRPAVDQPGGGQPDPGRRSKICWAAPQENDRPRLHRLDRRRSSMNTSDDQRLKDALLRAGSESGTWGGPRRAPAPPRSKLHATTRGTSRARGPGLGLPSRGRHGEWSASRIRPTPGAGKPGATPRPAACRSGRIIPGEGRSRNRGRHLDPRRQRGLQRPNPKVALNLARRRRDRNGRLSAPRVGGLEGAQPPVGVKVQRLAVAAARTWEPRAPPAKFLAGPGDRRPHRRPRGVPEGLRGTCRRPASRRSAFGEIYIQTGYDPTPRSAPNKHPARGPSGQYAPLRTSKTGDWEQSDGRTSRKQVSSNLILPPFRAGFPRMPRGGPKSSAHPTIEEADRPDRRQHLPKAR